ncbi:hypothetical protein GL213_05835 [Halogeometricum borinquense]|uniref:Uncharacterized protein n=1 Tax=Halogeometricum borinquense TaxID=60847 RepID=A0A6C0UI78_9EURY|nr:hypothetical protein [Halogeometricum borinquense]QIB74920.1 hypothetical protein G3I44_11900 [Halogeometricum borinquense]QIQ76080.1 hypothetical protein GL213_05835 [Halogeometricum borinquense]
MGIAHLVDLLRSELHEDLRCCVEYAGEEVQPHYLRSDVDPATAREHAHLLRRFYIGQESVRRHETNPSGPGSLRGSVHYFEELVAIIVPLGTDTTIGVFLDGDSAVIPEPRLSQLSEEWALEASDCVR